MQTCVIVRQISGGKAGNTGENDLAQEMLRSVIPRRYTMFDLVFDIFMVVGALTPLAAIEQWREFVNSRSLSAAAAAQKGNSPVV